MEVNLNHHQTHNFIPNIFYKTMKIYTERPVNKFISKTFTRKKKDHNFITAKTK